MIVAIHTKDDGKTIAVDPQAVVFVEDRKYNGGYQQRLGRPDGPLEWVEGSTYVRVQLIDHHKFDIVGKTAAEILAILGGNDVGWA